VSMNCIFPQIKTLGFASKPCYTHLIDTRMAQVQNGILHFGF
jgi:hypothetical protein